GRVGACFGGGEEVAQPAGERRDRRGGAPAPNGRVVLVDGQGEHFVVDVELVLATIGRRCSTSCAMRSARHLRRCWPTTPAYVSATIRRTSTSCASRPGGCVLI